MRHSRSGPRRLAAAGLSLLASIALGGCGTPPWKAGTTPATASPSSASPKSASASPTPTPAVAPSKSTQPVRNDLGTGSAKRNIEAGGVRLSINYWSTLAMSDWTEGAAKPLNLSASAKFIDGSEQNIFLSKVSVNIAVAGVKGQLQGPRPLVDTSSVSPGYLIKAPNSYGQVFTIPALATGATAVTLTMTYEMLVQSAPKAKTYAKQTGSNDLVIPIAT